MPADERSLYVYSGIGVEDNSDDANDNEALYAYSSIGVQSRSLESQALFAYSSIGIQPRSIESRALFIYFDIVAQVSKTTPIQLELLDSNWNVEKILEAK